ncbi:hypothetical protein [Methylomonas sp. AM2-LC]|uniref:hypothetical protein n=1 Tax=Methylomonas sp. AM2-LC TaxID=3153301 RepID=UPI00326544A9
MFQKNLAGTKQIFDSIYEHAPFKKKIVLTVSPLPVMPKSKYYLFSEKMSWISSNFEKAVNAKDPVVIPYNSLLAYDDRLLVNEHYLRLAEIIQALPTNETS